MRNQPFVCVFFIFLFLFQEGYAQKDPFENKLNSINALLENNRPKEAQKVIGELLSRSENRNNSARYLALLSCKIKTHHALSENDIEDYWNYLDTLLQEANPLEKSILHVYKVQLIETYILQNSYRLMDITEVEGEDIPLKNRSLAWWKDILLSEMQMALTINAAENKKTPIGDYKLLFSEYNHWAERVLPSLWDGIAYEMLAKVTSGYGIYDDFSPELNTPGEYMVPASEFVRIELKQKDLTPSEFFLLSLFQELFKTYLPESEEQVCFWEYILYDHLTRLNDRIKNSERIKYAGGRYEYYQEKTPLSGEWLYRVMEGYIQTSPSADIDVPNYPKALELIEQGIKKYENTPVATLFHREKSDITKQNVFVIFEEVTAPNEESLLHVQYKNVDTLFLNVYTIPREKAMEYYTKSHCGRITHTDGIEKLPVQKTVIPLPEFDDYEFHTTYVALPSLPKGFYALQVVNARCNKDEYPDIRFFWKTDLVPFVMNGLQDTPTLYCYDRNNDKPKDKVEIAFYKGGCESVKPILQHKRFRTGKKGDLSLEDFVSAGGRYWVELKTKDDYVICGFDYYNRAFNNDQEPFVNLNIFTDRAIYRPGQKVFFKVIADLQKQTDRKVLENQELKIVLSDVNGENIGEQMVRTNAYGSASGEFILPAQMLTGTCRIAAAVVAGKQARHSISFRVEEYKRPTFEIVFDTLNKPCRLGDSLTVSGKVKAYAGYPIAHAVINYTLSRMPYSSPGWGKPFPMFENAVETKGRMETDAEGYFEITFLAESPKTETTPWKNISALFAMEVNATDLAGETQSATWRQPLSEKEVFLSLDVPDHIESRKVPDITLSAFNINEKPQAVFVEIECFRLPDPKPGLSFPGVYCDTVDMSEKEFEKRFPAYVYPAFPKDNILNGTEMLWKETLKTDSASGQTVLSKSKWRTLETGLYVLRAKTYEDGKIIDEITSKKISFCSEKEDNYPSERFVGIHVEKGTRKVGDTLEFFVFSGAEDMFVEVVVQIPDTNYSDKNRNILHESLKLDKSRKIIRLPLRSDCGSHINIEVYGMKFGKMHRDKAVVSVQHHEDIVLHLSSFRSDLLPGGKEEWILEIKPSEKIKFKEVELLTTLYDQSLDFFEKLQWNMQERTPYSNPELYIDCFQDGLRHVGFDSVLWQMPAARVSFLFPEFRSVYPRYPFGRHLTKMAFANINGVAVEAEMAIDDTAVEFSETNNVFRASDSDSKESIASFAGKTTVPSFRKDFQETAFFYPELYADSVGQFHIRFTVPESLTRWQFKALAHDKTMNYGLINEQAVTSKQVMAHVNAPRFLREGDTIRLVASIYNHSEEPLNISPSWEFTDLYGNPIQGIVLETSDKKINIASKATATTYVVLVVPQGMITLTYRFMAHSPRHSDGEEKTLPILSNRLLVTETLPMYLHDKGSKHYTFEKLLHPTSSTLTSHTLTMEYTSNPVWNAILAMPYLVEYPHECNEQIFSRYYADALSLHILRQNPTIADVFQTWKQQSAEALNSPLEKNRELKQILVQETPWYNDALGESEQRAGIARLFDNNAMNARQKSLAKKLAEGQNADGGFPWFRQGRSSFYITGVILGGYGRLRRITGDMGESALPASVVADALRYLDREQQRRYEELCRMPKFDPHKKHIYGEIIYYLYARSFFTTEKPRSSAQRKAFDFWTAQAVRFGSQEPSLYVRALLATALYRMGKDETARMLVSTLEQNLKETPEMGLFPIKPIGGYFWYQAPVETQSALIETFDEVTQDTERVRKLQIWLLQNKRTSHWGTTKATVDAIYALLIRNHDLQSDNKISISIGGKPLSKEIMQQAEVGTGYIKTQWHGTEITPKMAEITLSKEQEGASWGAMYWQYFEDLDKITAAETGVKVTKQLYVVSEDKESKARPVTDQTELQAGQLVRVVVTLQVDRILEYVHLKDLRAAGLEPVYSPSRYYYRGGIYYYQNIQDAAVNFFIEHLPKGTHVFEYDLRVANAGNYSNGITTVQCMYAPEFSAHTQGIRVKIAD